MYYIFEWHYKELHLRGVRYHIVVIGKGDRATVEHALITRHCNASRQMANWIATGKNARLPRDDDSAANQVVEYGFGQLFWFATCRQ